MATPWAFKTAGVPAMNKTNNPKNDFRVSGIINLN
jgi:hypothetical protein